VRLLSLCALPIGGVYWAGTSPLPGGAASGPKLTVVIKATFSSSFGLAMLSPKGRPMNGNEVSWVDDEAFPFACSDFEPFKLRSDILLVGHAFSETPRELIPLSFGVGAFRKSAVAVATKPANTIPLIDPHLRIGTDPAGAKTALGPSAPSGLRELTERPDGPLLDLEGHEALYPSFNCAPEDQQLPDPISESATVMLAGLTRDAPQKVFRLPGLRPQVFYLESTPRPGEPADRRVPLVCDTLWVDVDSGTMTLTWRGIVPLSPGEEAPDLIVSLGVATAPDRHEDIWNQRDLAKETQLVTILDMEPPIARAPKLEGELVRMATMGSELSDDDDRRPTERPPALDEANTPIELVSLKAHAPKNLDPPLEGDASDEESTGLIQLTDAERRALPFAKLELSTPEPEQTGVINLAELERKPVTPFEEDAKPYDDLIEPTADLPGESTGRLEAKETTGLVDLAALRAGASLPFDDDIDLPLDDDGELPTYSGPVAAPTTMVPPATGRVDSPGDDLSRTVGVGGMRAPALPFRHDTAVPPPAIPPPAIPPPASPGVFPREHEGLPLKSEASPPKVSTEHPDARPDRYVGEEAWAARNLLNPERFASVQCMIWQGHAATDDFDVAKITEVEWLVEQVRWSTAVDDDAERGETGLLIHLLDRLADAPPRPPSASKAE